MKTNIIILLFLINIIIGCKSTIALKDEHYYTLFITNTLDYSIYAEALFLPITNNNVGGKLKGSNYVSYSEPIEILPGEVKQVMDYIIPNMLKIYKESPTNTPLIFYEYDYSYFDFFESPFRILRGESELKDDRYSANDTLFSYMPLGCDYGSHIYDLETRKKMFEYYKGKAIIRCIAPNRDYKDFKN